MLSLHKSLSISWIVRFYYHTKISKYKIRLCTLKTVVQVDLFYGPYQVVGNKSLDTNKYTKVNTIFVHKVQTMDIWHYKLRYHSNKIPKHICKKNCNIYYDDKRICDSWYLAKQRTLLFFRVISHPLLFFIIHIDI